MGFVFIEPQVIRKARSKQIVKPTQRRIEQLGKRMQNSVRLDLSRGMHTFRNSIPKSQLEAAWRTGSWGSIMQSIPWTDMARHLEPGFLKLNRTFDDTALLSRKALPTQINRELRYDTKNPRFKRWITQRSGALIVDISDSTKQTVQQIITRSLNKAVSPERVAGQLRGSIGLLPKQENAVYNLRSRLEEDGGYTPDHIDGLCEDYSDRLLDQRLMTIARTETRNAANQGQLSVWTAAADQDLINRDTARKYWIVDGKPCEICEPMDGEEVGIDEYWTLDNGQQCMVPTDSHPNCECLMGLNIPDYVEEQDNE